VPQECRAQLAQALLVLRELALLAQLALQAFKGQREQVLTAQPGRLALKAPLALQALPDLLALPVPLEQALQALQAFKDRLALLVLARLATMTWASSISKTTPPPRLLPPPMHAL
jgi:hypothetical protein